MISIVKWVFKLQVSFTVIHINVADNNNINCLLQGLQKFLDQLLTPRFQSDIRIFFGS